MLILILLLQCCLPLLVLGSADSEELSIYPVIMPMIVPAKNEVYLCTSVDLSQTNKTYWIKGFEPKVKNPRIHHMVSIECFRNMYIILVSTTLSSMNNSKNNGGLCTEVGFCLSSLKQYLMQ